MNNFIELTALNSTLQKMPTKCLFNLLHIFSVEVIDGETWLCMPIGKNVDALIHVSETYEEVKFLIAKAKE